MYPYRRVVLYNDNGTKKYNCICVYVAILFSVLGVCVTYKANKNLIGNEYDNKKISLQGVIYAISEKANSYAITITDITNIDISTDIINIYNQDHKKINKVLAYIDKDSMENIIVGNNVVVRGTLSSFIKPSNPGQFNEYNYYVKQQGYCYKVYVDTIENSREVKISIVNRFYFKIKRALYDFRGTLLKQYNKILDEDKAAIVAGMVLGDKSLIDTDIKDLYNKMGISHILSISGLHISFIGMILYKILSKIKVHTYITNIITIMFLICYGIMTDFSVSTNRAVVMMSVMLIGKTFGRTYDVYTAISLSLILILIQNPLIIYNTGLQFSYASVLGIILVYPSIKEVIKNKKEGVNSFDKATSKERTGIDTDENYIYDIRDGINKSITSFIDQIIAGGSIYIVNIPIMIKSYYEISVFSIIINILILPFISLLMAMCILSVIISFISIKIAKIIGAVICVILNMYEMIGKIVSKVPQNVVVLGDRDCVEIIIYYLIIIMTFYLIKKNRKFIYLLVLCICIFIDTNKKDLNITMLDVSQGDGICIESVNKKVITIDCGSTDIADLERYRLVPFLKSKGISKIDYAMISHVDKDHISGIEGILKNYYMDIRIKNIILPYIEDKSEVYINIINLARKRGSRVLFVEAGDTITIDNVVFKCLHPDMNYNSKDENGYSSVYIMSYKQFDMLLTGDISSNEEKRIIKNMKKYNISNTGIEVVKVPHHGSKYSSCMSFIRKLNPKYALISSGKNNMYGHPHKETLNRYKKLGVKVYTTIDNGAIEISTNGDKYVLK